MSSKFTILMRSHRAGSIYGRVLGVITSGNQKWEDRPLWFDAYSAHPPFEEPIFNIRRPKIDEPVRKIFYPEDLERARKMFAATGDEPKHDLDSIDDKQFGQQQQQN
uniref:Ribosomal protein S23 mitochondrial conserved domain-containing protein n=3 Tax=Meloidogyne incognita group TaxID=654580 RepID=A0A915LFR0_MELJA